jgi:hypothetical protein
MRQDHDEIFLLHSILRPGFRFAIGQYATSARKAIS